MAVLLAMKLYLVTFLLVYSHVVLAAFSTFEKSVTLNMDGVNVREVVLRESARTTAGSTLFTSTYETICASNMDQLLDLPAPQSPIIGVGGHYSSFTATGRGYSSVDGLGVWGLPVNLNTPFRMYCALKLANNRSIRSYNSGRYEVVIFQVVGGGRPQVSISAPSLVSLKDTSPNETARSQFFLRSILTGVNSDKTFQGKLSWSVRKDPSNPSDTSLGINYNGMAGETANVPVSIENNKDYSFEVTHRAIKPGEYKFFMEVVISVD
ncbi:hypothetical protein AB1D50_004121 [Enterobacter hormaechei]